MFVYDHNLLQDQIGGIILGYHTSSFSLLSFTQKWKQNMLYSFWTVSHDVRGSLS